MLSCQIPEYNRNAKQLSTRKQQDWRKVTVACTVYHMPYVHQFSVPENGPVGGEDITLGILMHMLDSIVDGKVIKTAEDYYSYVNYLNATKVARINLALNKAAYDANYCEKLTYMVETLGEEVRKSIEQADIDQGLRKNIEQQTCKRYGQVTEYWAYSNDSKPRMRDIKVAYVSRDMPIDLTFILGHREELVAKDYRRICSIPLWLKNCLESAKGVPLHVWTTEETFLKDVPYLETSLTLWEPDNYNSAFANYKDALEAARVL